MQGDWLQPTQALILVVAAMFMVIAYLRYKAAGVERRVRRMLRRSGFTWKIAAQKDTSAALKAIRRSCRKCEAEDICERWLDGEIEGRNDFCPNRNLIRELVLRPRGA